MVQITESLTKNVAHLARLELTEEELRLFTAQLGQVLGYVELLQEVNVSKVEPMTHPLELATPLREDVVRPSPVDAASGEPKTLGPAPDVLDGGFKVPPIV